VCAQRTGQSDQFKTVKAKDFKFDVHVPRDCPNMIPYKFFVKGAWPESRDPLNFWALNTNSSKTVKTTEFKFGVHVSRDSRGMTPLKFCEKGESVKIYLAEICTLTVSWAPSSFIMRL